MGVLKGWWGLLLMRLHVGWRQDAASDPALLLHAQVWLL
jgi:hypothetical protein